jgi:glycosyltransferase involved in cell wall biosynthesis
VADIKILLSAYKCDPEKGSETGNPWNWAVNLVRQGHEVWVLTHDWGGGEHRLLSEDEAESLHFIDVPISQRIRAVRGQPGIYLRYLAWQRAAYRVAEKLDARHHFDVVHHVSWGSLAWGSPLWRLGPPFILGPVGGGQVAPKGYRRYLGDRWPREVLRTFVVRWILPINPLTRRTVKGAHMVLVANKETLRLVQRLGAQRAHLAADTGIPPGYVETAEGRELSAGETLRIVWVGRLFEIKGLRLALEALSSVTDASWHLTVVGGGRLEAELPGWLKELGLEDRVDLLGQVDWGEVAAAYRVAHIMLFSSLRDSMGAQLFEAMGSGLPVVTLNHHGGRDMLPEEAATKVPVGTPRQTASDIAAAIREIAAHPEVVREMSGAALAFAAENTWEIKVQRTYELIERSLEP